MENINNRYPIIIELSRNKQPFKIDIKDAAFDKPFDQLTTVYQEPLRSRPAESLEDFEIITINS